MREWCKAHPEYTSANSKRLSDLRETYRQNIFTKLGKRCRTCGFEDERALQIDHIQGGGNKTRKNGYTYIYLRNILEDPEIETKFQILCANCNWIKKAVNQET
jgi:hypothetical protein